MKKLDRNQIEQTISSLLPDDEYRKVCLSLFVESILEADSYGENKWGVYCCSDRVRLLVGSLIVFTIHGEGLWITLDKQLLDEKKEYQRLLEASEAWRWGEGDWAEYKLVPSTNGYYVPSRDSQDIWPVIRDLHFEHISKTTTKYEWLRSDSQKNHSPELLAYISDELERSIPDPDYGVKPETNVVEDLREFEKTYKNLPETERETLTQSRIGQGEFRSGLIRYWKKCAVTGCDSIDLLRASHIKPWRDADNTERLDTYNGLLLAPNLDSAFDRGYISFDNNGEILISGKLSNDSKNKLGIHSGMKLRRVEESHRKYLEYHRQEVFR